MYLLLIAEFAAIVLSLVGLSGLGIGTGDVKWGSFFVFTHSLEAGALIECRTCFTLKEEYILGTYVLCKVLRVLGGVLENILASKRFIPHG